MWARLELNRGLWCIIDARDLQSHKTNANRRIIVPTLEAIVARLKPIAVADVPF